MKGSIAFIMLSLFVTHTPAPWLSAAIEQGMQQRNAAISQLPVCHGNKFQNLKINSDESALR